MSLFGPRKLIQSYEDAVALIEAGDAYLATKEQYDGPVTQTPLKNVLELDHAIYTAFAKVAESGNLKEFVCGPFTEWDGTSHGMFMDGMVFSTLRRPFMDALQHHRDDDGASYLWAFVTRWQSFMVLNPTVEVTQIWTITEGDVEDEFDSKEAMDAALEKRSFAARSYGQATRVKPVAPSLSNV